MFSLFRPRLIVALRNYSRAAFLADFVAGVTVGIIALALSMALGIASEQTPGVGITTAIVAGFLCAVLGGSNVSITGPTAAFIPVVVAVTQGYGVPGLIICTMLAGVMLIFMGVARFGVMIKFIPMPVIAGFTAGIATYIFSTQVKDFLGLHITGAIPAEFIPKMKLLIAHLGTMEWPSVTLAVASVALIKLWPPAWGKRVPPAIVAVVLGTILVYAFGIPVATIGSKFGADAIPQGLPAPHLPQFEWSQLGGLIRPAFTIALLCAIESLLCAVVSDGMIEDKHDSNTELIAQGFANIGSAFFAGLPATGAIARTAANVRSGGRSPVSAAVHALTLLAIVMVAGKLAANVPLPVLSAVLVVVAMNMGEWRHFKKLAKWPRSDAAVYLLTFILTVLTDITVAVEVGMVLAAVLFIRRIAETTKITSSDEARFDYETADSLHARALPERVVAFQLQGAFMFGAADRLETLLQHSGQKPRAVILGMKGVLALDATGMHALEEFHDDLVSDGGQLIIEGICTQPFAALTRGGFVAKLGEEFFCGDMDAAIAKATAVVAT